MSVGYTWNVEHREQKRAYDREYRRRTWHETRAMIFTRDHYICAYCLRGPFDASLLQVDHKQPERGGWNNIVAEIKRHPERFITSCGDCNRRKGAKSYEQFMAIMQPDRLPDWVTEHEPCDDDEGACLGEEYEEYPRAEASALVVA
jgi:5-methylcytosine-specific restriction endonuclease McrA